MQSIHVDESISSRRDAYLKITFSVQSKDNAVEINLYEPNGKKHQSKYNVKCRDSALFLYNSLEKTDSNQEIGIFITNLFIQILNFNRNFFIKFASFVSLNTANGLMRFLKTQMK